MTNTYLFYDIETTGLNKCFDQILQFAAIRTDLELKELERHEFQIKLNPLVVPAPQAVMTHRIDIKTMLSGEAELEAIEQIHALLNAPGTISVGYNTLGFDDEFLRFSFYRNLLPPYTHQFANKCSRMDIYPITIMYYLFKNNALNWPKLNNRVSLKLDNLNQANQLASGQAHNAMVDVEVTLALAKKLAEHKEMWDYVTGYFNKGFDLRRLKKLPYSLKLHASELQEGLMVSGKFGNDQFFQAPVASVGQHKHYRNQSLWLRLDQEQLSQTTIESIAENTFVIRKKAAEQQLLLPPLDRFLIHLSPERKKITDQNRVWLKENPKLLNEICRYHQNYKYPEVPNMDISAALYDQNFPPPFEEKLYKKFHQTEPSEKEAIVMQFSDPIRRELAMRLLAEYYPQYLSEKNKSFYDKYQKQCLSTDHSLVDYRGEKRLSAKMALTEIESLKQDTALDSQQKNLLIELEAYLTKMVEACCA